tara:strand:+ start:286 stop:687 length:402 start_codon:yes stop_codon:yes gene_type:complete
MFEDLNEKNYILYAMKYYENPQCLTEDDFYDDLKILKYLKRLFNRFNLSGDLKIRLILNHLIMFTNVFPPDVAARILFLKTEKEHWPILKTFLETLNFMPNYVEKINGSYIRKSEIKTLVNIKNNIQEEIKCQ